jgi:hypothetical protein
LGVLKRQTVHVAERAFHDPGSLSLVLCSVDRRGLVERLVHCLAGAAAPDKSPIIIRSSGWRTV